MFLKLELGINSSQINILNTKMTDKQDMLWIECQNQQETLLIWQHVAKQKSEM